MCVCVSLCMYLLGGPVLSCTPKMCVCLFSSSFPGSQTHISHGETNVAVKQGNLNCISVMIGAFLNNNEHFFGPCLCCIKGHSVFLMGILSDHVFVVMF